MGTLFSSELSVAVWTFFSCLLFIEVGDVWGYLYPVFGKLTQNFWRRKQVSESPPPPPPPAPISFFRTCATFEAGGGPIKKRPCVLPPPPPLSGSDWRPWLWANILFLLCWLTHAWLQRSFPLMHTHESRSERALHSQVLRIRRSRRITNQNAPFSRFKCLI